MNDNELLELAAKAAGINAVTDPHGTLRDCTKSHPMMNIFMMPSWNPLTDDGDALRLAVKLFKDIHFWYFDNSVSVGNGLRVVIDNDPYAATRRAIVRAAAEIGKGEQ